MSKSAWRIADYLVPVLGVLGACAVFGLIRLPDNLGLVMVLGASLFVVARWLLPLLVGRGRPVGEVPRPATGFITEGECVGWIGWVRFYGPELHVAVYEDRFVIETILAEHTIMDDEIISVDDSSPFRIVIRHCSELTTSPIRLSLPRDHPARMAMVDFFGEYEA